jgi:hypothetical protein
VINGFWNFGWERAKRRTTLDGKRNVQACFPQPGFWGTDRARCKVAPTILAPADALYFISAVQGAICGLHNGGESETDRLVQPAIPYGDCMRISAGMPDSSFNSNSKRFPGSGVQMNHLESRISEHAQTEACFGFEATALFVFMCLTSLDI